MHVKAVTFDTGGTILDWHGGTSAAFARVGARHNVQHDWHAVANDYRRLSMKGIVGQVQPDFNMDDAHRSALDDVLARHGLAHIGPAERDELFLAWHRLSAWPGFVAAQERIRKVLPVVSFTMLPVALVVDVSRQNGIGWDAIISCEMHGYYKPHPQAYLTVAHWLDMNPQEILMAACHNFDLDAARGCGFRTAFVRRPHEWGPAGPPDPVPNPACDIIVDDFDALADLLLA